MSKTCNVCGSMNNDTQQTCAVCGSALIQASAPEQPKIKYPIYENTDYAAIAARDAAKQASAKQRPMQPVQQRPAPQNKQPQKKNLTPIIISVVAAVVVVAVALGVIFGIVLPNKDKGEEKEEAVANGGGMSVSETYDHSSANTIAVGYYHTVGLKEDGSVVAVGRDNGECDVDDWTDIFTVAMDRLDQVKAVAQKLNHINSLKTEDTK